MSSGPTPPQLNQSPFGHFSYLFQQQHHHPHSHHHPHHQTPFAVQRQGGFKLKRQRQRVDAGEPRNSYQQQGKGFRDEMASDAMSALFPWMNQTTDLDFVKEDQPTDLSCKDNEKMDLPDSSEEIDQLDVETAEDQATELANDDTATAEPRVSNESANSTSSSSSSKRKSFQPQKNIEESELPEDDEEKCEEAETAVTETAEESDAVKLDEKQETENARQFEGLSALQSQLSQPNMKFNEMFETQRKLYSNLIEQQKKFFPQPPAEIVPEKPRARDFSQLAQTLKTEIIDSLSGSIDKVLKEWAANEMARLQQEMAAARPAAVPPMFNPLFPAPNPLAAHFGINPHLPPAGIFPTPLNAFSSLAALNQIRRPFDDDGPKKKRSKVTDSVRKLNGTPMAREGSPSSTRSSPILSQSTPLSNYFPPTMVGHPLYGGATFGEREGSPTNSDETSECGGYDGGQSSTLTPVHLRKAKLMFFYTRYPNSTLLKSYFPDVRFNKNNTAQLVKWFSNFREFYYIQMDKFARQALAEGITSRDDIVVTVDSEIFRTLNQHYNRNNHVQPPDSLVHVVQESLREFFDAIRLGKDAEPSWKKQIYKIINRLDDPIPEYFKDPNFLERLE
ncbi:hypothetical protein Y032_0081g1484 [Ancylostoma ceylanicum]|uniref:Prospero domain-containing protein n=2 Tax=Ancylostoma ceylanicum TaxID=53326 RepID=A0A016TSB4_9BILA|nr:hypothetical protein Y032_0081g1484 [Ancylostoma ceylanicum]